MLIGVILAGGRSRRMGGGDKCLLDLGGESLLARAIARLEAQTDRLLLNANGDPARFAGYGLETVADDPPAFLGPLAGVLAGMERAAALGAERIVTVAADTPFFPRDLAERLAAAADAAGTPLALAATEAPDGAVSRHPTFGLWATDLRGALRRALVVDGLRKIVAWTDAVGAATAVFRPLDLDGGAAPFDPFFNINTPEDLAAAEAALRAIEANAW